MNQMSKYIAEAVGTFWLAFAGCGSAVIAAGFPQVGIGLLGVSLAFGLTVLTIAYSIGHISGCHLNPAVTIGLTAGGRFPSNQVLFYIIAQAGRGRDRRRGALHHRQWRTRLRSGQRARGQRVMANTRRANTALSRPSWRSSCSPPCSCSSSWDRRTARHRRALLRSPLALH
jgi:hypothetical protein